MIYVYFLHGSLRLFTERQKGNCMKKKIVKIIYWFVFALLIFAAVYLRMHDEFDTIPAIKEENGYLIHHEPLCPYERVTSYIAEDGKLFIHYADTELVTVYSTVGEFLYGVQIEDGQNGSTDIAYAGGCLYIVGRGSGIYVFRDTELVRYEEQNFDNPEYDLLEPVFTGEHDHTEGDVLFVYDAEANKMNCMGNGESEDVIQFAQESPAFLAVLAVLVVMAVVGFTVWGDWKHWMEGTA